MNCPTVRNDVSQCTWDLPSDRYIIKRNCRHLIGDILGNIHNDDNDDMLHTFIFMHVYYITNYNGMQMRLFAVCINYFEVRNNLPRPSIPFKLIKYLFIEVLILCHSEK